MTATTTARSPSRIQPRTGYGFRRATGRTITYVLLALAAVYFVGPLLWLGLASFKPEREIGTYPVHILPQTWEWKNYYLAVTMADFLHYLKNSVFLASMYSILAVFSSALAGFAFARLKDVPGNNVLFSIVVTTLLLPGTIFLIPNFIIWQRLGGINTYWPWVTGGLSGSSFHIFLFRQFFASFPRDLEDAAEVDGCSVPRIFWSILLPNATPVLITSGIFNFQGVWGGILAPILYLSTRKTILAVVLSGGFYQDPHGETLLTVSLAATVLFVIPVITLFFLAQKYIVQGVVTTGLAGR